MITLRSLRAVVLALSLIVLAGCGTMQQLNRDSVDQYHSANTALNRALARRPSAPATLAPIQSNLPYVNVVPVSHTSELPPVFLQTASFHAPAGPLWQSLLSLQQAIGMNVHADDDVLDGTRGTTAAPVMQSADATLAPPPSVGGKGSADGARPAAQLGAIAFTGTTKDLLDLIAGRLDATWKYDAQTNSVHIYRFESRVFHIDALPGAMTVDTSLESGQAQQIQGAQGQQVTVGQSPSKTNFKGEIDVWKSVTANIRPMLSADGNLEVDEPEASITVRDRWERVDAIAKYVQQLNKSLGTLVAVNVKIYRVQQNNTDNRGISWGVLYNTLGQAATNFGVSISTPQPTATGLGSLILNSPTRNPTGSASLFSGSQFFFNALSTIGHVDSIEDATVMTVSNRAAPFKVVHSLAYVASTTPVITAGTSSGSSVVGAGATLQPGQVVTGFDMSVLPSVLPDGHRLLVQTKLSISNLDSMGTFTSGGNTVQQPNVSAREIFDMSWLKSGQALVLAGFQDTESNNTTQSVLDKSMWGLGGNRSVANTKDAIVVVITPVVTQPETTIQ